MDPWQIVALLAGALASTWTAFIAALFRGEIVPGHVYRREIARGDRATVQAERGTEAVRDLTSAVRAAIQERDAPVQPYIPPKRGPGRASG